MPIIEGRAPLVAFVSDLVGEAALQDAAADTGEDAALFVKPTICDAASAPSVERLAWACYRLLTRTSRTFWKSTRARGRPCAAPSARRCGPSTTPC